MTLYMKNAGMSQYRFKQNPLEEKFAVAWDRMQHGRYHTLDYLLAKEPNKPSGEVSDRDRMVAATVIQWLGSPVGQSFLRDIKDDATFSKQENP